MSGEERDVSWICVDSPPGQSAPKWALTAAIDDRGVIYGPAVILGNELNALVAASWDGGIPAIESRGHIYLPTRWMAEEDPRIADICEKIESCVRRHFPATPQRPTIAEQFGGTR